MKRQLSNCEMTQLSTNVFEATPKKGIVVNKECVEECRKHWDQIRTEPFGVLINCKNKFSRSIEGSRDEGKHPLQKKTAILLYKGDRGAERQLKLTEQIKELEDHFWNHKVFSDRDEAIEWLSDI